MFLTDCHTCGLRELRGIRSVESLVNTDHGLEMVYRCTRCETLTLTGPTRSTAPAAVPATDDASTASPVAA
ncbi:MAG: hypothetical protein ACXV4A_00710 [Actinomycetes bacterium]